MNKKTRDRGKPADADATRNRVAISFASSPSRTHQEFKDSTDINILVKQWRKGRPLPIENRQGTYGDFSTGDDFHSALERVIQAEENFAELPAKVRDACRNDPGLFLDMMSDPESREALNDLGLKPKPSKAAPNASPDALGSPQTGDPSKVDLESTPTPSKASKED
ncbi:internal scaffolding protein [Microviridae sp.]|nr:internal scaffolding protein [Microviridae sp.]